MATGIPEYANYATNVSVYPNPSKGKFNILVNSKWSLVNKIQVYNALGEEIYSSKLAPGINTLEISASNGVYMYRIISDNDKLACQGKLVIQ